MTEEEAKLKMLRAMALTRLLRRTIRIPEGMYVDHIDGDPRNNELSNLRLMTKLENRR